MLYIAYNLRCFTPKKMPSTNLLSCILPTISGVSHPLSCAIFFSLCCILPTISGVSHRTYYKSLFFNKIESAFVSGKALTLRVYSHPGYKCLF